MYEEFFGHFGLQRNPFHVSPDPKRFFSTVAHDEALLQLVFGIESRKGLLVLTGEPGTGKTTILQYLLEWLGQYKYSTAYVFHTLIPSTDLMQLILRDFGIPCVSRNKSDLLGALKEWLVKRKLAGDCPVIIVDEAQALTNRALEELGMLLNIEDHGVPLVQLVLAGQPQLEEKLNQHKLSPLRQRIMCHCRLRPLTLNEVAGYIGSRLQTAGAKAPVAFPQEAVADIYRYTKGIPRVVNLFCEHSLLAAYADKRDSITCSDVRRVAQQFDFAEDCGLSADPFIGDTFCRLIPFPKLGSPEPVAAPPSVSVPEDFAQPMLAVEPVIAAPVLIPEPLAETLPVTVPASVPAESLVETEIEQPKRSRMSYWGAVGKSFMQDCREFSSQFGAWLRSPLHTGIPIGAFKKIYVNMQSWLKLPAGSAQISNSSRRFPSAAQKQL
jgi:general secretion pathway protein A